MELRTVRRGLAALAIASTLGLAGAHPAAAAEPGWFEQGLRWLSALWPAGETRGGEPGTAAVWAQDTIEKVFGMDPNGTGGGGTQGGDPPPGGG